MPSSIAILQLDGKGAVLVENVQILRASVRKPLEAFQDATFRSLYAALTVLALSLSPRRPAREIKMLTSK